MTAMITEMWFVHVGFTPPLPVKLERIADCGARVVGGKTGSHRTGHGETYWDKIVEIIRMGFIPVDIAKDLGRLTTTWTPPNTIDLDSKIKEGFYAWNRS